MQAAQALTACCPIKLDPVSARTGVVALPLTPRHPSLQLCLAFVFLQLVFYAVSYRMPHFSNRSYRTFKRTFLLSPSSHQRPLLLEDFGQGCAKKLIFFASPLNLEVCRRNYLHSNNAPLLAAVTARCGLVRHLRLGHRAPRCRLLQRQDFHAQGHEWETW